MPLDGKGTVTQLNKLLKICVTKKKPFPLERTKRSLINDNPKNSEV